MDLSESMLGLCKQTLPPPPSKKARDAGQAKPVTVHYCYLLNGDKTKEFLFPFIIYSPTL